LTSHQCFYHNPQAAIRPSLTVLVFVCFWSVDCVFGLFYNRINPSRPIYDFIIAVFEKHAEHEKTNRYVKGKESDTIPPKYDTSIFQKKGDCIEGMPIPIFQIIQQYLDEQDYRDLVNSNLSTFQPIKYETVHYSLLGPDRWFEIDFCADENKEASVRQIINSVKDKSKQIPFRVKSVTQPVFLQYAHLFEGIGKLTLELVTFKKDFPCAVFDKVRHLVLSDLEGGGFRQMNFDFAHLESCSTAK
jgi:hypothetical protein